MNHTPATSMPTRGLGSAGIGSASTREGEALLGPHAEPESVVDQILSLLSEGRFQSARRMAEEARARFPEHRRVQNAWRIFDKRANAVRLPGSEPSRREEFNWLRNPPQAARGKWVALVGKEMVAAADTLADLVESLRSQSLPKTPLVHFID